MHDILRGVHLSRKVKYFDRERWIEKERIIFLAINANDCITNPERSAIMAATIKDIAREVGVSPSTVSRVINKSAVISADTTEKINQAMKRLGYHPNSAAKKLVMGSTNTVALVIDADNEKAFANNFFNRSIFAIENVLQKNGYDLLIVNGGTKKKVISNLIYEKRADGVIIPSSCFDAKLMDILNSESFPYIILGAPGAKTAAAAWVDIDNEQGGYLAVKHLQANGYTNIFLVLEDLTTVFAQSRQRGFQKAMEENGQSRAESIIQCRDMDSLQEKVKAAIEIQKADAFLCSGNEIAYYVLKAIAQSGYKVPADIGVVTFDNYPLAEFMAPPLTAVDINTYELGRIASQKLLEQIKNKELRQEQILLAVDLIVRRSSQGKV